MSTTAGFQVPVKPLVEVFGRVGTVPLSHIMRLVPNGNVGVALGITVTVIVMGNPHVLASGVNV